MNVRLYMNMLTVATTLALPGLAFGQGKSAVSGGKAEAEEIVDTVVDRLWELTDVHWHKGEYNHIVNLCKMVVAADPSQVDAFGNAGWLLWSMNRDAEAIAVYEAGLKANPNSFYMYDELGFYYYNRKKNYPAAIKYLERASQFPDSRMNTLHTLAHAYEKSGNLESCAKTWERAAKDPGDAAARTNLARVRKKMRGQQDKPN